MKDFETWASQLQQAVDNPTDNATVISVLTQCRDDYRDGMAELTAAQDSIAKLQAENSRLMDTNRELFLRIGQASTIQETTTQQETKSRAETITIDDLFKEE